MSGWPGDPANDAAETAVTPPPARERTRADSLRDQARAIRGPDFKSVELLVLSVLEVSAAVDRLTAEVKRRNEHDGIYT